MVFGCIEPPGEVLLLSDVSQNPVVTIKIGHVF
jgi:hypothetical protein